MYSLNVLLIIASVLPAETAPAINYQIRGSNVFVGMAWNLFAEYFRLGEDEQPVRFQFVTLAISSPACDYSEFEGKPFLNERDLFVTAVVRMMEGDKGKIKLTFKIPAFAIPHSTRPYFNNDPVEDPHYVKNPRSVVKDVKFVTGDGRDEPLDWEDKIAQVRHERRKTTLFTYGGVAAAVLLIICGIVVKRIFVRKG